MDSSSSIISIDNDALAQGVARECLGDDPRLTLEVGDGIEFLKAQPRKSFDMVFADAMAGKYEGLEDALAVVKEGGFYVIDDMLPQANWPEGHAAKVPVLLEKLGGNREFEVVPLAWASGVVLAVRRGCCD
jgi:predicted O-methyltransferase YrrM